MSHSSALEGLTVASADNAGSFGYRKAARRRLRRDPVLVLGVVVLAAIILMAILAPLVAPQGSTLGAGETGRDLWARVAFGARLTLLAALAPVMIALLAGGLLGIISGLAGGSVGTLLMRTLDVVSAFPSIALPIAICGLFGGGLFHLVLALAVMFIPSMAGFARASTAELLQLGFVEAARAGGTTRWQILRHHVLPNVLGPILAHASGLIGGSVGLAAGLNFLGLGVEPPAAEWGLMLQAWPQAIEARPLVAVLPGVMIVVTSLCCNLVADRFRAAMDVRLPD
jgi:peptide/nickel transport system permease protein